MTVTNVVYGDDMARLVFSSLVACVWLAACSPAVDLKSIPDQPDSPPVFAGGDDTKIRIVGSSTVSPFATAVAEQFGAVYPYPTPIVETTGTGGGFKAFCNGLGPNEPSITNASRKVKASEVALCAEQGVTDLVEIKIGYDGIVLANAKGAPELDLTKGQIYQALAAELPDGRGGWVENPYERWREIDASLPDLPIRVSGPPPTSGTRDAFVEIAMEKGAETLPELAALKVSDPDLFERRAHTIRNDGAWIDSGENDSSIVQTLLGDEASIGVLGFSFLEQNLDRLQGARIGGIPPEFNRIASGDYGISRSMYLYVKKQNVPLVPGLGAYLAEFTHEDAWGMEGYLLSKGLIPLPEEQRIAEREEALNLIAINPVLD